MVSGDPSSAAALREGATTCLRAFARGDRVAGDRLFEMLYADLHSQAQAQFRHEGVHTLQTTALVHEAWMRLINHNGVEVSDRGHFLALAARAMRHILVDHVRSKRRQKRGGKRQRVALSESSLPSVEDPEPLDILAVDEALERLRAQSERLARVVEMRFFAGVTIEEVAEALDVDRATVVRDWRVAKGLLTKFLGDGSGGS